MTAIHTSTRPFWAVAHRGVRTDHDPQRMAPENTIPAFQEAARHGAAIELDVMLDADGDAVVHHDDLLGRMFKPAGKQKEVRKNTWNDLQKAKLNVAGHEATVAKMLGGESNYKTPEKFLDVFIPKLSTVLDAVPNTHIFVELKPAKGTRHQLAEEVMRVVEEKNAQDRVTLISFDGRSLREVKKIDPKAETKLNFELPKALQNNKPFLWAYVNLFAKKWVKADGLQPNYESTTPNLIKISHKAKLPVAPWVNHETRAEEQQKFPQLMALGVNGIITNAVDLLNQALGKNNSQTTLVGAEKL